jgi:hypothetical protein
MGRPPVQPPPETSDLDVPQEWLDAEAELMAGMDALVESPAGDEQAPLWLPWHDEVSLADVLEAQTEAEDTAKMEADEREGEEAAFRADMGLRPWPDSPPVAIPTPQRHRVRPHARRRRQAPTRRRTAAARRARGSPSSDPDDPEPPGGWRLLDAAGSVR